ncbi:glycosyl hydrolase family 61-domain-containing protein [Aspergillus cavernicola]|uniref:AA9 family lytic polysaccharide monooxygenase n=1 Tax=Aspergillus cavernicola TaxID=176166 RepID=A0ABR4HDC7_9EURO
MHFFNLLAILPVVAGHTLMTTLYVDGENQGDGVCIRQNRDPETATYPIIPLANDAMACGYDGETASSRLCPASQDSTLTFEFREYPDGSSGGSIDESHKGPCAVYMKRVEDATSDNNAAGDGWFKIFSLGYDTSTDQWCTEKLIANDGFLSVKVPTGIQGGPYLVRTELLALHASQDTPPDPQFYVGCAQVFVDGDSDGDVPEGVVIDAGTYDVSMPALVFNIYAEPLALPYPSYGPAIYTPVSSRSGGDGVEVVQAKGLQPAGCILVRDDWCGFEVPSYSDQDGCWASAEECWDQADVCWNTAPPTGSKNCQIWSDKCTNIGDQCDAGNWNGPPNKGEVLTPALKKVGGSLAVFSGGNSSVDSTAGSQTSDSTDSSSDSTTSTSESKADSTSESSSDSSDSTVDTTVNAAADTTVDTADEPTVSSTPSRPGKGHGRCKARRSHKAKA